MEKNRTAFRVGEARHRFSDLVLTNEQQSVVNDFHKLYYDREDPVTRLRAYFVSWLGYETFKCPLDLWVYQEILVNQKPDVIIETGTYKGGSALFLANVCDLIGHGEIITIDIATEFSSFRPNHPRITYLTGSSTDQAILSEVERLVSGRKNVMVVLDSEHACDHVLGELRTLNHLVPRGGYLIVEDTNINGHPAYQEFGPGPWEAVERFLTENKEFYADRSCERFLLTMNPRGFLRRRES